MRFRSVLADCLVDLRATWITWGHGAPLDSVTVSHAAWADDTWVLDSTQLGLESMRQELRIAAQSQTGLVMRWEKCACAQATGPPRPPPAEDIMLSKM